MLLYLVHKDSTIYGLFPSEDVAKIEASKINGKVNIVQINKAYYEGIQI